MAPKPEELGPEDEDLELESEGTEEEEAPDDEESEEEAPEGDESDEDDESDDESDGEVDEQDERPRKKNRVPLKKRLSQLTERARAAELAAMQAEMRLIEREKAASTTPNTPATALKEPNPNEFQYGEVDAKYLQAVVDYRVQKHVQEQAGEREKALKAQSEEQTALQYRQKLEDVMDKGAKRHSDFANVVNQVQFDPDLARQILDSENPVDIAYFLAHNVGELRALLRKTPVERARDIGRLEGRFSAPSAARKRTKAPEAMTPKKTRKDVEMEQRYGPRDQADFDKVFFGRK